MIVVMQSYEVYVHFYFAHRHVACLLESHSGRERRSSEDDIDFIAFKIAALLTHLYYCVR